MDFHYPASAFVHEQKHPDATDIPPLDGLAKRVTAALERVGERFFGGSAKFECGAVPR